MHALSSKERVLACAFSRRKHLGVSSSPSYTVILFAKTSSTGFDFAQRSRLPRAPATPGLGWWTRRHFEVFFH